MEAMLARWRERIAAGDERVGWKVGINVPAVQEALGISHPVAGYLTSGSRLEAGASFSRAGSRRLCVEPEIVVRIGQDLSGGSGRAVARAAIQSVGPAIEVVDLDRPLDDLEAVLAGNVFHRAFVLGPMRPAAWDALQTVRVGLRRDGHEESTTKPQASEEIVEMVDVVADLLARFGERLKAGDVVITGSLTRPVLVERNEHVTVTIDPLGSLGLGFVP